MAASPSKRGISHDLEPLEARRMLSATSYTTQKLVSDGSDRAAARNDSRLKNPWGLAVGPRGIEVAVNGTGDTDWSSAELWLALAFLVVAAQVFTYMGFYVALARWTSARVFSWTFLVPAVAVVVEAMQGELPSAVTCIGMVVVIAGVAAVTHPRAEPRAAVQVQQADG